ncbi:hypothetical protein [Mycolicibacterium chlorophenolicum]|uniref:Uncharacterized protein n=1 Tax=Mycolicibacterium chlorophenolicum TaxID=37916 RepID=A0A0J6WJU2_9MYCO|nr:hypothetical protein [Mycolicibacterium chlorophenolicum]KMO82874.1 hypothetical protein MCHLDSM_00756 [Mycolicibacterium chlorophenolicum]
MADTWEDAFDRIRTNMKNPGGTPWVGEGAAAAQDRAQSDHVRVQDAADGLRLAAAVASSAANEMDSSKKQALMAIGEAEAQGFFVGDDLSLSETQRTGWFPAEAAAREAQAEAFAADIQTKAAALAALDADRAAQITAAVAVLDELVFVDTDSPSHTVKAVDWKQAPAEDTDGVSSDGASPVRGLPPEGVQPPVPGDVTPGPASRPSEAGKGGQSLWDQNGGEWRYFPGDRYHNPHWDFNPHDVPNAPWDNIPIGDLPPVKDSPVVSSLPPWLQSPPLPNTVEPGQNPLLAPFPGNAMPGTPVPAPGPVSIMPRIDIPAPNPQDMANAGATGTGIVTGGGLLALLYLLFVQN